MDRGYTAIEMLVVLTIVAIASSIAFVDFLSQKPRSNLRLASRLMISHLRGLRQQSIATGLPVAVYFSDQDDNVEIEGEHMVIADNEYVLVPGKLKKRLPAQIRFGYPEGIDQTPRGGVLSAASRDGISFNHERIFFEPNGTTRGLNGQIYLTNAPLSSSDALLYHDVFAVDVNVTGQIRLYQWNGAEWH